MELRSSNAREQPGTQSSFIISYLLSATKVHGAGASLRVRMVGWQALMCKPAVMIICRCMAGYMLTGVTGTG